MEEEIDLRQYIVVLIKYRYWIIGLMVGAALVAFIVSSFIAPTYEATALVTAAQQRYVLQFDSRLQNVPDWSIQGLLQAQYRTYPTLATSAELLQKLADKTGWSLQDLTGAVKANGGQDPTILVLTVNGKNAEEAAKVSNTWATLFIEKANALYGNEGELEQFRQQLQPAQQSLAEADTAITVFRQENGLGFVDITSKDENDTNRFGLIGQRLQAKNKLLTDYETQLVRLRQMMREVELLSKSAANSSPTLIAGLLAEMVNTGVVKDNPPFQIKLDSVDPAAALPAMNQALQSQVTAIETEITSLRPDITTLQAELATKQKQFEQLNRDRTIKSETFTIIARKVKEAEIDANLYKIQIASQATTPLESIPPKRLLNTVVAGALGLMLGIFGAFALEWWRKDAK